MIFEKVRDIICDQFDVEEDAVTPETLLEEDLDADSLDLVDLVMSFEDEFQIEVPEEEIENIKTVGDIVKYIEEHKGTRNARGRPSGAPASFRK